MRNIVLLKVIVFIIIMSTGCSLIDIFTQSVTPTEPSPNVTCGQLSLYLNPALGKGAECQSIPENSITDIPMDIFIFPDHLELTLIDYPLSRTQFSPMFYLYPVSRFSELLPDVVPHQVANLENIMSGEVPNDQNLPFLPPLPLEQTFFSNIAIISFHGGKGVRYITQFDDYDSVINNKTVFYTFQGITDDGKYWLAITLPISSPTLPADDSSTWPPEGYTAERWAQNYDAYVNRIRETLDTQNLDSFFPAITELDSLIVSITYHP